MRNLHNIFILVILICSTEINTQNVSFSDNITYPYSFSLTSSLPILITKDSNFTDYGFPGNGTPLDPYRIENLNITTTEEKGIYVFNTTKHFIIQNCFVDAYRSGIFIDSVRKETTIIEDNICVGNSASGIRIKHSPGTKIINNTCNFNSFVGIHVGNSSYSQVNNNICSNNNWDGIFVDLSNTSSISNNTCNFNSKGGIVVEESPLSYVAENKCKNNDYSGGISLFQSNSSVVADNLCVDNVQNNIALHESNDSYVLNNYCSGRGVGIVVADGGNVTIDCNNCSGNAIGILIKEAEKSKITNNILYRSGFIFYELNKNDYNTYIVLNNTVNDKKFGYFASLKDLTISKSIYGQLFFADCSNVRIRNQYLCDTITGITMFYCSNSLIQSSVCSNNRNYGINIVGSTNIEIINNNCSSNYVGILIENSDKNELSYNFLQNNIAWGVVLDAYSSNNSVHHNSFYDNNQHFGTSQALDHGTNNIWYDEQKEEGNYWGDYSGIGNYSIDGSALAEDLYPLSEPPVYRNNNIYYAFLSLIVFIPLIAYSYFRFSSKRKR